MRPGGWLSLDYSFPLTVDALPLGLRLEEGGGRALATIDRSVGARLTLRIGAGVGVDIVHVTPRLDGTAQTTPGNEETFALFVARASVRLLWCFSPSLGLTVAASVDVDPSGSRYVALVNGAATPVLSPWPVRPAISLGLAIQQLL